MNFKKRLQQERETGLGNIVFKPWFPVVVFLILGSIFGPEAYRHFKKPTIEDCTDYVFMANQNWKREFIQSSATEKLQKNATYETYWEGCELRQKKFPKKFEEQFKGVRKSIDETLSKKSAWNDKKN